jgi:hypothetical protein
LPAIALINEFDSQRFTIKPIGAPNFVTEIYRLLSARHTLAPSAEQFINMLVAACAPRRVRQLANFQPCQTSLDSST